MSNPIQLLDLPNETAREILKTGVPVYLLVNPVEYHGPHLPLGNDHNLSEALSRELHRRLQKKFPDWPLLMAPPLHIGVEPTFGPGSVPVPFKTVRDIVLRSCKSLVRFGAKRVVLMTFHGNPFHSFAIEAGARYLRSESVQVVTPFNTILQEMLEYEPGKYSEAFATISDPALRQEIERKFACDFHAGFFETSMALHYRPDTVSPTYRQLSPCPELKRNPWLDRGSRAAARFGFRNFSHELGFAATAASWMKLKPFPGYSGWPHAASSEAGAKFAAQVMNRFEAAAMKAFQGEDPGSQPIFAWLEKFAF